MNSLKQNVIFHVLSSAFRIFILHDATFDLYWIYEISTLIYSISDVYKMRDKILKEYKYTHKNWKANR